MSDSYSLGWHLTVDTNTICIETNGELHSALQSIAKNTYAMVILYLIEEGGDGPALYMLKNGDRTLLTYIRYDGDAGFTTRDPDYQGPSDSVLEFYLNNGQLDHYPVSMTIPFRQAQETFEYFFEHHDKPSWISWHDDSGPTQK